MCPTPNNCHFVGDLPAWVELAFTGFKTLTRVELYTSHGYPIANYDLQVWTGQTWRTVASVIGNTALRVTHQLDNELASKVRVVGYRGPANQTLFVRVNELEVMGY